MDSLTHIAIGACMGEAFAGKTVGRKAMLWGALAQSIPDVDFIAAFWLNTPDNLLAHRGFTHSLFFAAIISPLLALTAEKLHRPHNISFLRWCLFFGAAISGHLFMDAFNNYGVAWFEPFSHHRISFNAIYVADPFFSIWPGIAFAALLMLKRRSSKRVFWWKFGLYLSGIYLAYCITNKVIINNEVKSVLSNQHISYNKYFTTPTPLQNLLWYVVAANDSGYYVGYCSLLDKKDTLNFEFFKQNAALLQPYSNDPDIAKLIRFSQGYYTAEYYKDTLVFNDLRFGQEIGWEDPCGKFSFHYYINFPKDNLLVVQRGRFARWNWDVVRNYLRRIKGK
ncbi:MAG: metal-dependent hydrolase [Ferruginibacter sp.]